VASNARAYGSGAAVELAIPTRASEHKRRHNDQERDADDDDDDKYR